MQQRFIFFFALGSYSPSSQNSSCELPTPGKRKTKLLHLINRSALKCKAGVESVHPQKTRPNTVLSRVTGNIIALPLVSVLIILCVIPSSSLKVKNCSQFLRNRNNTLSSGQIMMPFLYMLLKCYSQRKMQNYKIQSLLSSYLSSG